MRIGVTDTKKPSFHKYAEWLTKEDTVEVVKLSSDLNNADEVNSCKGVLLTGGEDVHPKLYGKPELFDSLDPKDINEERDSFEMEVIAHVKAKKIPMLAICRGMQIANVAFGGTLIPDLPSNNYKNHRLDTRDDEVHPVQVSAGTMLFEITRTITGEVNSRHHQAVDLLGVDISAAAISDDGVVEAIEWKVPEGKPFFLGVQWHPERMLDFNSPFSKNILKRFLLDSNKNF